MSSSEGYCFHLRCRLLMRRVAAKHSGRNDVFCSRHLGTGHLGTGDRPLCPVSLKMRGVSPDVFLQAHRQETKANVCVVVCVGGKSFALFFVFFGGSPFQRYFSSLVTRANFSNAVSVCKKQKTCSKLRVIWNQRVR